MTIYSLGSDTPQIDEDTWIAPDANVIGKIILAAGASVWFGATLRGDNEAITVGEGSNIQENAVIHNDDGFPVVVGKNCTIGHKAMLHGCEIGDQTLVGMGATVLNGAKIGKNCLIGAGALVTEGKEIPDGSLVVGSPGRVIRQLDEAAIESLLQSAVHYQDRMRLYRAELSVAG
ncbi:MAG: gamma carbonic anhydrase family protein [Rhodobacteraceae bacterium]|nr:gamma carbonic anhydrase family protein [Paracoccaceae bacterium]